VGVQEGRKPRERGEEYTGGEKREGGEWDLPDDGKQEK